MKRWTIFSLCSFYLWTIAHSGEGNTVGQSCTTLPGAVGSFQWRENCPSLQKSPGQNKNPPIVCCPHQIFTRSAARRTSSRKSGTKNRGASSTPNLRFVGCGEGGPPSPQRRTRSAYEDEDKSIEYFDDVSEAGGDNVTDDEYGYRSHFNLTTAMIVGGSAATPHSWPWMAGLVERQPFAGERIFCGGTLITNYFVLTAAHCVTQQRKRVRKDFFVRLGGHTLNDGKTQAVHSTRVHPRYSGFYNDIAVVKLAKVVVYTAQIRPVCLPTVEMATSSFQGKQAMVTGWGTTSEGGRQSSSLKQASVKIIPRTQCDSSYSKLYRRRNAITANQLCAGAPRTDTCQGDSGGPLSLLDGHGKWCQIGITSFGYGCAHSSYPGVYTRVGAYLPWIKSVLG